MLPGGQGVPQGEPLPKFSFVFDNCKLSSMLPGGQGVVTGGTPVKIFIF
jgi:hypothetical protein